MFDKLKCILNLHKWTKVRVDKDNTTPEHYEWDDGDAHGWYEYSGYTDYFICARCGKTKIEKRREISDSFAVEDHRDGR